MDLQINHPTEYEETGILLFRSIQQKSQQCEDIVILTEQSEWKNGRHLTYYNFDLVEKSTLKFQTIIIKTIEQITTK